MFCDDDGVDENDDVQRRVPSFGLLFSLFFFALSLSPVLLVLSSVVLVVLNMSNKKIENEKGLQKSTISKKRIIEKKKTKKKKKHIF